MSTYGLRSRGGRVRTGRKKNRVITLSDDEPEEADPTRPWLCNICPIVLSDPEQIRVLIPCGHAFCVDCAGNSEYCPICDEAVDAISTPKLQEGEAVDEEEEAEKQRKERSAVEEELRKIEMEETELKQKWQREEHALNSRMALTNQNLKDAQARMKRSEFNQNEMAMKLKLAKFVDTIVNQPTAKQEFPLKNAPNVKAYYSTAALRTGEHFKQLGDNLQKELTSEKHRFTEIYQQHEVFERVLAELEKGSKEPNL